MLKPKIYIFIFLANIIAPEHTLACMMIDNFAYFEKENAVKSLEEQKTHSPNAKIYEVKTVKVLSNKNNSTYILTDLYPSRERIVLFADTPFCPIAVPYPSNIPYKNDGEGRYFIVAEKTNKKYTHWLFWSYPLYKIAATYKGMEPLARDINK